MFEQGFYNQLGYGTGGYEHRISFDPSKLNVSKKARIPKRLTSKNWKIVHSSRLNRLRGHGSCNIFPPDFTRAELYWQNNGFGLGYMDDSGKKLTHHFWCDVKNVGSGPYHIQWMVYQNMDQFLELMALLKNLGDQVRLVKMREPQGVQLQDFLHQPFREFTVTEKSKYESNMHAYAYWQMRICDLQGCLEKTHLPGDEIRFNLKLNDPIVKFLDKKSKWRGISGNYVITLGPSSHAKKGNSSSLPTLHASVGAFTRMWLGFRPASGLAMTDELSGPQDLLEKLDWALRLPDPKPDWDF
jgi:predicted acetyltransferase